MPSLVEIVKKIKMLKVYDNDDDGQLISVDHKSLLEYEGTCVVSLPTCEGLL